tara:strand:- start:4522 stop:4902 length:381 start_codon:yes stop_codon:yes gene_type:complete
MSIDTDVFFTKKDLGKNLYSKKTYYTVMIEQHVLANDSDDADKLFLDGGGIDHNNIFDLAENSGGVETTVVDANYTDSDTTTFLGKVAYDEDDEYAEEDGSVVIDTNAEETSQPTNRVEQMVTSPE